MLMSTVSFGPNSAGGESGKLQRQFQWCGVGLGLAVFFSFSDYRKFCKWEWPIFGLSALVLVACFLPEIGRTVNGSSRWVGIPGTTTILGQPSEAARIGAIIFLASWCARFKDKRQTFTYGFLYPLLLMALPIGLIGMEVDLGTSSLLFCTTVCLLLLAGVRWLYVGSVVMAGVMALGLVITLIPNRKARINAFLYLESKTEAEFRSAVKAAYPNYDDQQIKAVEKQIREANQQQEQALAAMGSGGPLGRGLGEGRHKQGYLPLPFTDFIFPNIGEELGLGGTLGTIFLFCGFCLSGFLIASRAQDRFGQLLGTGIVLLIVFQALINIAVVTGCFPNKGFPLPFVSYGGSNLACCMAAVGILLSIHRHGNAHEGLTSAALRRPKLTPSG